MTKIYYSIRNERLKPIERRPDGLYLYENLDDGGRVVCDPGAVNLYPKADPIRPLICAKIDPLEIEKIKLQLTKEIMGIS